MPTPPVLASNRTARAFRVGNMVVTPDKGVGMIDGESVYPTITVKFGADGPHSQYPWHELYHATPRQIKEAGYEGVGYVE